MLRFNLSFNFSRTAARRTIYGLSLAAGLLLAAPFAHADEAQKHFEEGMRLHQANKIDDSLAEFNQALKHAPKDATILRWVGFVHLEKHEYEAARTPLEKAIEIEKNSVVAHLNLGNVYDGLKMYPRAIEEFQTVVRLNPNNADAWYNMGLIYQKTKRNSEAVEAFRKAAELDGKQTAGTPDPKVTRSIPKGVSIPSASNKEDPAIHASLGDALMAQGDAKGAAAAYQKATELAPDNSDYQLQYALALRKAGSQGSLPKPQVAANSRKALKAAYDHNQRNYQITELYAETLFDQGANEEAALLFEKASDLDKSQFNAAFNLGVAQYRLMHYGEAEKAYTRAIANVDTEKNPNGRKHALNGLGLSQLNQKKYSEASETFKTITTEDPSNLNAWINMVACAHNKQDDAAEIEGLKGAIANGGRDGRIFQLRAALGAMLYKKGDTQGALDSYSLSDRAKPNQKEVLNGMALCEQKLGMIDDAIRHLSKAILVDSRYADAYNNRGVAYETRFKKALEKDPKTADKTDIKNARADYVKALEVQPNHPLARKNLDRFDEMDKQNTETEKQNAENKKKNEENKKKKK